MVWSVLPWFVLVWSGLVWSGLIWSFLVWYVLLCSGLVCSDLYWSGLVCSSMVWSGLICSGLECSTLFWSSLFWSVLVWSVLVWSGLICSGLECSALFWFGLFWSLLVWFVLVWSGLVCSGLFWSGLVWSGLAGLVWHIVLCSGLVWSVCSGLVWRVSVCVSVHLLCKALLFSPFHDIQTQQLTTSPNATQQTVRSAVWSIHISVDIYANVKRCCVTESNHFLDRSLCRTHLILLIKRRTRVQPTEGSVLVIPYLATTYDLVPDPSIHHPWNSQLNGSSRHVSIGLPSTTFSNSAFFSILVSNPAFLIFIHFISLFIYGLFNEAFSS
jgi:hypothetical protein